jgi:transposase InsO family protein
MKTAFILFVHAVVSIVKLLRPGGVKCLIAENLAVRHQLIIANRSRKRSPNLTTWDRFLLGIWTLFVKTTRVDRIAIVVRPATLFKFHDALKKRKYRHLFSAKRKGKPGPKGPSQEVIESIVEMKRRNPRFGCPRIAEQIAKAFGIDINKDVVRRVLAKHYRPFPGQGDGPSWLTVIGHIKDSLWSVDLFRCESILLKAHWVMVVMDQYTRRIIGFGVQSGDPDGAAVRRMFNQAIAGMGVSKYLSTDNDPLYRLHRWQANLRILEMDEIKSVPYVPISHPFVERLIGTIRREYLDHVLFWNAIDLERKLSDFRIYYNDKRVHTSLECQTPAEAAGCRADSTVDLANYRWDKSCGGLVWLPVAA